MIDEPELPIGEGHGYSLYRPLRLSAQCQKNGAGQGSG